MTESSKNTESPKNTGSSDTGSSKNPGPLARYRDSRKERIDALAELSVPDRSRTGVPVGAGAPHSPGDVTVIESGAIKEAPGVSLWASAWRRLRRNPVRDPIVEPHRSSPTARPLVDGDVPAA